MIEIGEQGHLKCWADKRPLRKASSYWDHSGPCLCPPGFTAGKPKNQSFPGGEPALAMKWHKALLCLSLLAAGGWDVLSGKAFMSYQQQVSA